MSDTPRTDAMMTALLWRTGESLPADVEFANFARQLERENAEQSVLLGKGGERECALLGKVERLERENAALREKNAEWREMIREAVFDNNDILYWIRGARSVLLDEVEKDHAARKKAQP